MSGKTKQDNFWIHQGNRFGKVEVLAFCAFKRLFTFSAWRMVVCSAGACSKQPAALLGLLLA